MSASSSSDSSTSAQAAPTSPCSSACSRNTSSTKWGDRVILGSVTNCIVIACLVIVGLFLCKYYTTSTDNEKTPRVCHTEACIEAGKSLYESINFTVKPCDDFYEYACGNWIAKNPIPDDDTAVSSFKIVQNSMSQILRRLLEQNASQVKNPPETVKVALDLYRECMDEKSREKVGIEPLVENLFKMIGKHWPVMRAKKQWFGDQLYSASIETFVKFWGHVSVISWFIHVDEKNATQKMLHFIPPRFGIGRIEYSEPKEYESLITAYKKYMRDVATLFIDEVHPARNDESAFTDRIEEIFKFESRLALASSPPEEMRDSSAWYNKMTLGDFKHLTGYFNWIEFLNAYTRPLNLTNKFTYDTQVIVMDKGYYSKLGRILAETPIHVLQNYMGFMYIASMSRYTNQQLINATFEFHKEETGAKELEPLWERCVAHVDIRLPYAVSRLYVDQHTEPGTKEQTEELIADLKATFRKLVQSEVPWLDETTRKRALDKVDNMVTFVAYPEWIHNNTVVDEDAGFTDTYWAKVKKGRYLEAIIRLQRIEAIKAWKDLAKPRNLTLDWMMPPTEVNAAYGATHNGLLLPAAILHPPFFNPDRPAYLNYAAIGSIIGHEITHGFDDAGHEFDKTGSLVNWWTNETMEQFKNTSQCFIDQYGAIVDNTTGKNLNGEHTLGENIADNGGIREAYFAFQLRKANKTLAMEVVPQMEKFTIEQLFFLSYAKVWCANVRVESLRMDIDYDPHAPKRYRVNIPLSNFEEFSNAFKCPTGSTMNPSKKCILW